MREKLKKDARDIEKGWQVVVTKEDLKRHRALFLEAEQIRNEVNQLYISIHSIKASTITDMPTSHTSDHDKIANSIIRVDELKRLYGEKINKLIEDRKRIEQEIEQLEPLERMLIRYRYFDNMKWEEVAVKIGYSWAQMHRLHARILIKLKDDTT